MKSELKFYDAESNSLSSCGDVLDIVFSNRELHWPGIVIEKAHRRISIQKTSIRHTSTLRWHLKPIYIGALKRMVRLRI